MKSKGRERVAVKFVKRESRYKLNLAVLTGMGIIRNQQRRPATRWQLWCSSALYYCVESMINHLRFMGKSFVIRALFAKIIEVRIDMIFSRK